MSADIQRLKVFISYSRRDAAFADRLVEALRIRGFEVLIDRRDLPALEDWERELLVLIRQADTIIFIVSPHSLTSKVVSWEVEQVRLHAKRLAPIVIADVGGLSVPHEIARINHLYFTNEPEFEERADELARALNSDVAWLKEHTRVGEIARRWNERGNPFDLLLRGQELEEAQAWAARRPREAPVVTEAQQRLIEQSRKAEQARAAQERRRNRLITAGSLAAVVVVTLLGWFFYKSAQEALRTQSLYLVDLANQQLSAGDLVTAQLLAAEGLRDGRASNLTQRIRPYAPVVEGTLDAARRTWETAPWKELRVLRGHDRWVWAPVFSPDGRLLLTASLDTTARIWDVRSGKEVAALRGHKDALGKSLFTVDGRMAVTASYDKSVRLWDVPSGRLLTTMEVPGSIYDIAISADGRWLATVSDDDVARLWELPSGRIHVEMRGHSRGILGALFSPDGKLLATSSNDKTIRFWEVPTGLLMRTLSGHEQSVSKIAFSPNGLLLASMSGDGTARMWEVSTGESVAVLRGHSATLTDLDFSPDGRLLATASVDRSVRIWNVATRSTSQVLEEHQDTVGPVRFSPDGRYLASASNDRSIRIWEVATGKSIVTLLGHTELVGGLAFSFDGTTLATTSRDTTTRLWQQVQSTHVVALSLQAAQMPSGSTARSDTMSRDGRLFASGYGYGPGRISIWATRTGELLTSFLSGQRWIADMDFSPDGKLLASSSNLEVKLWDVATGTEVRTFSGVETTHRTVRFSQDGRYLAAVPYKNAAQIWDIRERSLPTERNIPGGLSGTPAFSPDGRTFAASDPEGAIYLWDLRSTDGPVQSFAKGPQAQMAFSPDGLRIAAGAVTFSGRGRLIEKATGRLIEVLIGHHPTFSLDGRLLATAFGAKVYLWQAETGEGISVLHGHKGNVRSLAFSLNSRTLFSASIDGEVRTWSIYPDARELLANIKGSVPRCLTPAQRNSFHLPSSPPRWCHDRELWPYASQGPPPTGPQRLGADEALLLLFDALIGASR